MSQVVQPPSALALILCDAIYRDCCSGKMTLLGCFAQMMLPDFPACCPRLTVYAVITDGLGRVPITLRLVDADETKILGRTHLEVKFDDPRAIYELDLTLQNVILPEAGIYRLQLLAGDEVLQERSLPVSQLQHAVAR